MLRVGSFHILQNTKWCRNGNGVVLSARATPVLSTRGKEGLGRSQSSKLSWGVITLHPMMIIPSTRVSFEGICVLMTYHNGLGSIACMTN